MKIRELFEEEYITKTNSFGNIHYVNDEKLKSFNGVQITKDRIESIRIQKCPNFSSFEGLPNTINGYIDCSKNRNLTSLKGIPQKGITHLFVASCDLKNLDWCPNTINGDFDCSGNYELNSLKGVPQTGVNNLYFPHCNITSLEGLPRQIGGALLFYKNPITSLKGIHKIVNEIKGELAVPQSVISNILGVLKIRNVDTFRFGAPFESNVKTEISDIINKYLPNPNSDQIIDCQNELIEAGFEEYAEL